MGSFEKTLELVCGLGWIGRIARVEPGENFGIGVSTVDSSDEGLETALLHKDGISPVERYDTREEALEGHDRWVKKAARIGKRGCGWIVELGGLGGMVENERKRIVPRTQ